jgi:hypothetical protein
MPLLAAWLLAAAPHGDGVLQAATTVAISPLPYGINVHLSQNDVLARVKAAGIAWIRIDVDWSAIEASQGTRRYEDVDRVVDFAAANGLSVYASIGNTPGWANGNKGKNHPADNPASWSGFVGDTVGRYRDRVKYWGIWNEPNLRLFFALGKDTFVQRVLVPAAQAIRSADPAAFIVGPELSHKTETGSEWYFWMKYILDNAGGYFDIISHHLYEDHGVYYMYELLEQGDQFIPAVKRIVEEAGQGGKPFWITETGWNTNQYAESVQASRYLDMLHARARKGYPQKVFFYEIVDVPSADPWGILRSSLDAKPAYTTYRDYIAGLLPDPGDPDEGKVSKKCYAEQAVANGAPLAANPALRRLYRARDFLRGYSPAASDAVDAYYQWNEEFLRISLADSRVFALGREILEQAAAFLAGGSVWQALEQPLPQPLMRSTLALLGILKADYAASPIAPLVQLAGERLAAIGRATPRDLLDLCLHSILPGHSQSR